MEKSHKPLHDRKYSIRWANSVVEVFWKKYPRAAEFVRQLYGVDQKKAAWLLANHQRRWCRYKQSVKIAAKWYESLEKHSKNVKEFTPQVIHSYSNLLQRIGLLK
jgi:hypothetical protein